MEHLKFENTEVFNFKGALRGMRNPKNSWHLSDSLFGITPSSQSISLFTNQVASTYTTDNQAHYIKQEYLQTNGVNSSGPCYQYNLIGEKDMKLAQRLIKGGPEHRKFLRQIFVCVDITAPLYWWKEFDTYKVGTVANSTSTMHKLAETPITRDCFLLDKNIYNLQIDDSLEGYYLETVIDDIIAQCEKLRVLYNETQDIKYWRALIELLPNSWIQTRTVTMNYENLLAICSKSQRRNHKLVEWREDFITWARSLPYAKDFIFLDEEND